MIGRRPWWSPAPPPRKVRGLRLTDKGLAAIGQPARPRGVPLLVLPWRPDWKDHKPEQPVVRVNVHPPDLDAIRAEGYARGLADGRQSR